MIEPFAPAQVRGANISYGLSSYGYDIRLAGEFKMLTAYGAGDSTLSSAQDRSFGGTQGKLLDPKAIGAGMFVDVQAETFDLTAHTFVLGRTVEYFRIPPNVLTLCVGKSSYARCGVLVNVTPFEPAWEGHATLCIANVGPWPVRLYAGEGIAQVIFLEGDEPCEVTYADKQGKYQAQQGITPARLG